MENGEGSKFTMRVEWGGLQFILNVVKGSTSKMVLSPLLRRIMYT